MDRICCRCPSFGKRLLAVYSKHIGNGAADPFVIASELNYQKR